MVAGIRRVRDILYEFKEEFLPEQFVMDAMQDTEEEYDQKKTEGQI
ncbi:MAG: hypothetical protein ACRCVL_08005 [Cetobacterium sp.]